MKQVRPFHLSALHFWCYTKTKIQIRTLTILTRKEGRKERKGKREGEMEGRREETHRKYLGQRSDLGTKTNGYIS